MAKDSISHEGKIIEISPEFITVEILSSSACAGCHSAAFCGIGDAVKKAVEVPATLGNWYVGQEVNIVLKRSMGFKAVWLAYLVPLAVLMTVLLSLYSVVGELLAGALGIAAAGLYYLILWLFRNKLRNEYSFYIKEK